MSEDPATLFTLAPHKHIYTYSRQNCTLLHLLTDMSRNEIFLTLQNKCKVSWNPALILRSKGGKAEFQTGVYVKCILDKQQI